MDRREIPKRFYTFPLFLLCVSLTVASNLNAAHQTSQVAKITRLTRTYYSKFFLRFSPNGSHIAYSRHHRNLRGTNQILVGLRLLKADGSQDRALLSAYDSQIQIQEHACWSPDGNRLVISGGGNDTGNSSKDTFICKIDGEFKTTDLKKLVPGRGVNVGEEPCFSPDGKQLAFVSVSEQLWIIDSNGKNKLLVLQVAGQYCHQPAWSPDGQWIAFASDRDGNVELYKVRWDGTELTRLTNHAGFDCRPRWSRDGNWILFTSNRSGNHDVFLMRPDGTKLRQLTKHSAMDDHADWSPDGKSIAFVSMRDGGFDIYRMNLPSEIKVGKAPPILPRTQPPVAVGDLVAHYDFEDQTGQTVQDRAGRNSINLFGAKVVRENGRGSISFNGRKDYAVLGNAAELRIAGSLSISLWIRPDKASGNGYLISKHGWNIYLGTDLTPRFETRTAKNDAWNTLAANTPLKVDEWSHVTAVFDPKGKGAKLAIYVNGKLSAVRPRTDAAIGAVDAYPLEIGHYNVSKTQNFHGRLDEIQIYRKSLSEVEIEKVFRLQSYGVTGQETTE
jgi:TolB protein